MSCESMSTHMCMTRVRACMRVRVHVCRGYAEAKGEQGHCVSCSVTLYLIPLGLAWQQATPTPLSPSPQLGSQAQASVQHNKNSRPLSYKEYFYPPV